MQVNERMSVLFWTKKQRLDEKGLAPVYARITIDKIRSEFSTGKRADLEKWVAALGMQKGNDESSVALNKSLTKIRAELQKHYDRLEAMGETVDSDKVKNSYLGITQRGKTLKDAFEYHNTQMAELVEKEKMSPITLGRYETLDSRLSKFIKYKYKARSYMLNDLKFAFITEFKHYLTVKLNIGSNTADKYIGMVKKVIKHAVANEWIKANPFVMYQCKYVDPNRDPLYMHEIKILLEKDFQIERLNEARDVFIFCCFTGLGYSEIYRLEVADIITGIDGKKWINKDRQKTDNPELVPILPIAEEIISKYRDHPHCVVNNRLLKVNSNQKYNAYLKEIANVCGIKKKLTTHIARHTFATTITLENDVPLESVSKMLGHKTIKSTQIYAKASQRKIANNMNVLTEKLFEDGKLKTQETTATNSYNKYIDESLLPMQQIVYSYKVKS